MTVKELIEKLQQMPQDLTVINRSCSQEVDWVELDEDDYCDEEYNMHTRQCVSIC